MKERCWVCEWVCESKDEVRMSNTGQGIGLCCEHAIDWAYAIISTHGDPTKTVAVVVSDLATRSYPLDKSYKDKLAELQSKYPTYIQFL